MSTPINPPAGDENSPQRGGTSYDPDSGRSGRSETTVATRVDTGRTPGSPSEPGVADRRPGQGWADAEPESRHLGRSGLAAEPNAAPSAGSANVSDGLTQKMAPTPDVTQERHVQAPVEQPVVTENELRPGPAVTAPDRDTVLARERDRFGGMKLGSAFFGWLTATGLAVLLLAVLAAAGVAFGVTDTATVNSAVQQAEQGTGTAKTVGLVGGIVLLVILFVAYYCGGYVAARMARFDGLKQGFAVWLWAIFTAAVAAAAAAIAGAKYNILAGLNLPRIPVQEGTVTTAGLIAIGVAVLAALLGALVGGAMGTRYHRKVDAVGFETR